MNTNAKYGIVIGTLSKEASAIVLQSVVAFGVNANLVVPLDPKKEPEPQQSGAWCVFVGPLGVEICGPAPNRILNNYIRYSTGG